LLRLWQGPWLLRPSLLCPWQPVTNTKQLQLLQMQPWVQALAVLQLQLQLQVLLLQVLMLLQLQARVQPTHRASLQHTHRMATSNSCSCIISTLVESPCSTKATPWLAQACCTLHRLYSICRRQQVQPLVRTALHLLWQAAWANGSSSSSRWWVILQCGLQGI
jgi:hypothetical protein